MAADPPSPLRRTVLSLEGVRKQFRSRNQDVLALAGIGLLVSEGEFVAVLGPSGSGKTTLLRCIAGFEKPDAGVIILDGRTLDAPGRPSVSPHDRGIGIVPQEGALFPHLSVAGNIGFGLTAIPRSQRRQRVDELLDLIGMPGLGDRRPHQLSGGQQQRVALARALAPEPNLILLDEPFSALDAKLRVELREEIVGLVRRVGATAVLVTHDQTEALSLADQLVVMRDGRVVAAGEPRDIYEHPPDLETGRFLGKATVLPGIVVHDDAGTRVDTELGRLPVAAWHGHEGPCHVLLRPEQLTVTPAGDSPTCAVTGVVLGTSYFGADAQHHVRLQDSHLELTVRTAGQHRFVAGDLVHISTTQSVCTYPIVEPDSAGSGSGT